MRKVSFHCLIFLIVFPQTKVFGVTLESLPHYNMECGSVPRQVDMLNCLYLNSQLECYFSSFLVCLFLTSESSFFYFSFLVEACMKLLAHVDTEGLFRKSGSVVRLKALRVSDGRG